jgi:tRNA G18 (ribose-2'-O)-methylase SpoU
MMCRPVKIPLKGEVRSLNLAVSAGIALYECWRQLEL